MKEKYRVLLQKLLEDMQRRERIENAFLRIEKNVGYAIDAMNCFAAVSKIIRQFVNLAAQYEACGKCQEMQDGMGAITIETTDAAVNIQELFEELSAYGTDKKEYYPLFEKTYDSIPPRKLIPRKARTMASLGLRRHRARDTLPN